MTEYLKVEGFAEFEEALKELPRAVGKGVVRRVLTEAAQPIAQDYRDGVDVVSGDLRDSIGVGTKLSRRQARLARRETRSMVEVHVGAGPDPAAHLEEFGSSNNAPNPAMRNAWERGKHRALESIKVGLAVEIEKARQRAARKAARLIAKNGTP